MLIIFFFHAYWVAIHTFSINRWSVSRYATCKVTHRHYTVHESDVNTKPTHTVFDVISRSRTLKFKSWHIHLQKIYIQIHPPCRHDYYKTNLIFFTLKKRWYTIPITKTNRISHFRTFTWRTLLYLKYQRREQEPPSSKNLFWPKVFIVVLYRRIQSPIFVDSSRR